MVWEGGGEECSAEPKRKLSLLVALSFTGLQVLIRGMA